MIFVRETGVRKDNPIPVLLIPTVIPHGLVWDRARAGGQITMGKAQITSRHKPSGGLSSTKLRYKPLSRGFDSRWSHWNVPLTKSFRPHYSLIEMSTTNITWGVKAVLLPSSADCMEIWEP